MSQVEETRCNPPSSSSAGGHAQMPTTQSDLAALQSRGAVSNNPFRATATNTAIRQKQPMTPDTMMTLITSNPLKFKLSLTENTTVKQRNSRSEKASAACAAEDAPQQHKLGNEQHPERWTVSENPFKRADRDKRLSELQIPSPLLQPPAIIFEKYLGKMKREGSNVGSATSSTSTCVSYAASEVSRVSTPLSVHMDSDCESSQKEHLSSSEALAKEEKALFRASNALSPISFPSPMQNNSVDLMQEVLPEFPDHDCQEMSLIGHPAKTAVAHFPIVTTDDDSGELSLPSNVIDESRPSLVVEVEVTCAMSIEGNGLESLLFEASKAKEPNECDKLFDEPFEDRVIANNPAPIRDIIFMSFQDSNLETEKLSDHVKEFDGCLDFAPPILDESMIVPVERPDDFSFNSLFGSEHGPGCSRELVDPLSHVYEIEQGGHENNLLDEIDLLFNVKQPSSNKADNLEPDQEAHVSAEGKIETANKPGPPMSKANLPLDQLPEINLDEDWFSFASPSKPRQATPPVETDVFSADKSFQNFLALCLRLANEPVLPHVEEEIADNGFSMAPLKLDIRNLPVIGELETFQVERFEFETDRGATVGGNETIAEEKRLAFEGTTGSAFFLDSQESGHATEPAQAFGDAFFLEESPSLETAEASFEIEGSSRDSLNSLSEAEATAGAEILPEDLTRHSRLMKRPHFGLGNLWRSDSGSSLSSVFSVTSLSSLWNRKKQAAAEGVGGRKKNVRWGLARAGQLEQTKVFNPDAPVFPEPVNVARENGILLFRFDSVSDVVVPDNLPVSINITLTYNCTTSVTIPQFVVQGPAMGKSTEIDFEYVFYLPSPSIVRQPPKLDITLRVAPIVNPSDKNPRLPPLIAQGSRSNALPSLFRMKPAVPVQDPKEPTLPLSGISTRGVLIPNVLAFAAEADGECRETVWTADFGAACGGVQAKFCVKGIGIVEAIVNRKVVILPDTFSEAAYGVELKHLHESLQLKGFMSQIGGGLTNWRRRYFELVGCKLYAYNTETKNLMMTLNLALVKSIKACGVVATVTPKSQRRVAIDEDKLDLTNENSIEISRSFSKSPVRRRTLTATSNVDDASSCHMVNEFEIEMKDGEIISFSTLGEAFEEDDPLSPNNSHSVSPQRHEPWWKLGSISANDDMIPCESMDSAASVLHENFLDGDFDEVFEEIHITSPSRSEQQYNFEQSREELRDGTASVTRRWLREICRAASTIGDETLPDWLTHY